MKVRANQIVPIEFGNDESSLVVLSSNTTEIGGPIHIGNMLIGLDTDDILIGTYSSNWIFGEGGNDTLQGGIGADTFDGGAGFDWVSYATSASRVQVSLLDPQSNIYDAAGDIFISIEGVQGSNYGDVLIGSNSGMSLSGLGGNDWIKGGNGVDDLNGGQGNDTLIGGTGADRLTGGSEFDFVSYENSGAEVLANLKDGRGYTGDAEGDAYLGVEGLWGSIYNDQLTGDDAHNWLAGDKGHDLLVGEAGNDTLDGGDGNDTLQGGAGDDVLYGIGGEDVLEGGSGADSLYGGWGNDWVSYASSQSGVNASLADGRGYAGLHGGTDAAGDVYYSVLNLEGSQDADMLIGDSSDNWLKGLSSDDTLQGGVGADTLDGGSGFNWASYVDAATGVAVNLRKSGLNRGEAAGDVYMNIQGVQGSAYNDTLVGSQGSTKLLGLGGDDILAGVDGADILDGGDGKDILQGISGNDALLGGNGNDTLEGGEDSDTLEGGTGADRLDGGAGDDWASYASSTVGVLVNLATGQGGVAWGGANSDALGDTYASIENAKGGAGHDVLIGTSISNWLFGLAGDDILRGGAGGDMIDGGTGFDWASYRGDGAVQVDLSTEATAGGAAGDQLTSIEGLEGSEFGDSLTGNGAVNALYGYGGADTLRGGDGGDELNGGDGDDFLYGEIGADALTGGAGRDTFGFNTALGGGNVDRLLDFNMAEDTIALSRSVFTGLPVTGPLQAGNFRIGAVASTSSDRVIYNAVTGELFYDADGTGAAAQVKVAELAKGLALTAANFIVV